MLFNKYQLIRIFILAYLSFCDSRYTQDNFRGSRSQPVDISQESRNAVVEANDEDFYLTHEDYEDDKARPDEDDYSSEQTDASTEIATVTETQSPSAGDASVKLQSGDGSPCGRHKACSSVYGEAEERIENLKKTILEKLRMSAPPNITEADKVPSDDPKLMAIMRRYGLNQSNDDEDDLMYDSEIKAQKLFSTAKSPIFYNGSKSENWFYFNFTAEEREFDVRSADLFFYLRPTNSTSNHVTIQLDIYTHHRNATRFHGNTTGNSEYTSRPILRRALNLSKEANRGHWRKVSLTNLVAGWIQHPQANYGIKIYSTTIPNLVATGNGKRENKGYKPFLDITLVSSHRRRRKRSLGLRNCDRNKEDRCCLFDYNVNFDRIGWGWIVFPKNYNLRYCDGDCSVRQTSTTHGDLVYRTNSLRERRNKTSCCVPQEFAPLSMVYLDETSNIVYTEIPNIEIHKCGCA